MKNIRVTLVLGLLVMAGGAVNASAAVDVDAAKALGRQNNCFKCHSVDKEKEAPTYKKIAEKYRGKAGAEETLIKHLTTGQKVKFADGHEEEHKVIRTKDAGEIKNLVDWILSL